MRWSSRDGGSVRWPGATGSPRAGCRPSSPRYRQGGYEAIEPRSKRPKSSPHRIPDALEDEIVALRKDLGDLGLDDGPRTIAWYLWRRGLFVPAESTISRVLVRRGFVTPQPKKRPKSSYVRFEAKLPNECWQSDITHWCLADGTEVEIMVILDDHSRACLAAVARPTTKAADVVDTFLNAAATWGYPASVLTDIQADWALGSTVRPAGGGKLRGDRCPLCIAAHRSERLTTPCLLGASRAGATPGKERPVRYSVTDPRSDPCW
jgi:transposase InsO family protein